MTPTVTVEQLNNLAKRQKVMIYFIDFDSSNYNLVPRSVNWAALDNERKLALIESKNYFMSKQKCDIALSELLKNK